MRISIGFLLAVGLSASAVSQPTGDRTLGLLKELANAPGPSGFEEDVRRIVVREVRPFADKVSYDGLGSVIAQQGTSGPKIMLDAHMDELGGVVRRVTENGFLSMQMLGGWLDQALELRQKLPPWGLSPATPSFPTRRSPFWRAARVIWARLGMTASGSP